MKKILPLILLASLATAACQKHDEIEFSGQVLMVRSCSASYLDANAGFVVALDYPEGIGGTLKANEGSVENVIVLYEPTTRVRVEDHITGTFYLDNEYSRAHCSVIIDLGDLPEGVMTDVTVD